MDADRPAAAATPPGADDAEAVQRAVEQFIERHAGGGAPDLAAYVAGLPEALRPRVLAQCREYLAFDGLLGHQTWREPPAKPTADANPDGRTFGDFVILEELGRGGMGVVYLAHQKSLHRRVALKVMASGLTLSKRHVERFRREAAAAAQVRHPAIVPVHTLTEVDGTFALAMDFVAGRNLGDILDDLRLQNGGDGAPVEGTLGLAADVGYVAECAMFLAQLASCLAAAHRAGVVHRDLKPRNLMLDDQRQVRLLDFGLAKSLDDGSISISGELAGTPHYMSPEQTLAKRVEVDHRADVWALGVILYELLTLKRPFDGKNLQQIVYEICFQEPTPIQRRNPRVPRDLATIGMKALEKDPARRYASAAELEADLQRFLRWEPIQARPASPWSRAGKWMRRHRTETAAAAALALAGVVALGIGVVRGRQADGLLTQAAAAEQQGRLDDAYQLAAQALALRPDEATRARMERYAEADKRIAAESAALAMRSANLLSRDRERALQLALQADDLRSSASTRTALLEALGSGSLARTLRPLEGGALRLVGARLSPDGTVAATIGFAGHAQLWNVADGLPRAALRGHAPTATVVGVAFCGDGSVATAGSDRTLRWWRAADGAPLRRVELPGVAAALFASADGARLLALSYSGADGPSQAQAFDATTGAAIGPQRTLPKLVEKAAFSPDGRFAAASVGQDVQLWRIDDGAAVDGGARAGDRVRALAFTRDGARLAVGGGRGITVLATEDGGVVATGAHSQPVTALAFDAGGARLLSGARDRTARIWQLPAAADQGRGELREIATLTGHQGGVDHVAFDAADQFALTATGDGAGELRVFDVGSGRPILGTALHRHEAGPSIEAADFAADGRLALAIAGQDRALVWDFGATRGVATLRQAAGAAAVAAADANSVVTVGSDGRARLWRTEDGALAWATAPLGDPLTSVDVDATSTRFAAASRQSGTVRLRDVTDGAGPRELAVHGEAVTALRFLADGRLFTAGVTNRIGEFALWNAPTGERLAGGSRPRAIAHADVLADGSLCAVAEVDDATVRLLTLPAGLVRAELPAAPSRVVAVQFTKAGDALLVAERDGLVTVYGCDGARRTTIRTDQTLRRAVWSPDGAAILTGGDGSAAEAVLWQVADGSERLRFRGHRGPIEWATFLGDGSACATAARDGTVCLWPTDPAAVARRLVIPTPPAGGK